MLANLFLIMNLMLTFANGNRVGNGGDVVICKEKTHLLDVYEFQQLNPQIKLDHQQPNLMESIITKLYELNPSQSTMYKNKMNFFKERMKLLDSVELTDLKDENNFFLPADKNCILKQIAIRDLKPAPGEPALLINKIQWQKLSPLEQQALLLHEVIYEHLYSLGEKDSKKVRGLVRHMLQPSFLKESKSSYWEFIRSYKLPIYQH